jgi:hypothetical protein
MVPVNHRSHGGSQSSFEAQAEACESEDYWNYVFSTYACWSHVCQA